MNVERLTTLAKRLARMKSGENNKHFNLAEWYHETECGTSACAIGYACGIKSFNKEGFGLWDSSSDATYRFPVYRVDDSTYSQWAAVMKFFDLPFDESEYLFSQTRYPKGSNTTPKEVATRIREYIKAKKAGYGSVK